MAYLELLGGVVLSYLVVVLMGGTLRFAMGDWTPNLIIITVWLFTWLSKPARAYRWAVILGLMLDLISFRFFGFWIVYLVVITALVIFLKSRFLEISSSIQAVVTLLVMSILYRAGVLILDQTIISFKTELISLTATIILGVVLYYALAVRWRLFAQWTGRRI